MPSLDTTALSAVLKQKYTQKKVYELCYKKNPAFALIKKRTDFGGKNKVVAIRYGVPQGRGFDFATALANMSASQYTAYTVTRVKDYAFAQVTGEAIAASKGDANSLLDGITSETDNAFHTNMRSLAVGMFSNGGGARGQIASGQATPTITLVRPADITNFEVGMKLNTSTADGTSGAKKAGTVTITALDRIAGTITVSGNWSAGIATVAANDYIFQNGDFEATKQGVSGFAAWLPTTAPTSGDNFFGVDRSTDVVRLAGLRISGASGPFESTLIDSCALLGREGSSPDICFVNPLDWATLAKQIGSKVMYDRAQSVDSPDIGFKAIEVMCPTGNVKVVADPNCPKGLAYLIQSDTWSFESAGPAPGILNRDGNDILRDASSDSYIIRVGYYGNMICEAPGLNAVITW